MQPKLNLYINIGGTSRSGSTLLGKILSNDVKGLYTGEMQAIFYPKRIHHYEVIKEVKSKENEWNSILQSGFEHLPSSIFNCFKGVKFIVDSSKNSFWITKLVTNCKIQSIKHKNVLIYKDPKDFAYSILKRGEDNWEQQYINYHKKYFSNITDFYVISFTSFVKDKKTLLLLCKWLGISYSDSKYNYRDNIHQGFFGSNTPKTKKNIEFKSTIPKEYIKVIEKGISSHSEITKIWNFLRENENKVVNISSIRFNKIHLFLLKYKNKLKTIYRKIDPENYFKK